MNVCSICNSPSRDEVDKMLVQRLSVRDIAVRSSVSKSSIQRHKMRCFAERLAKGREHQEILGASRPADAVVQLAIERERDEIDSAERLREHVRKLIREATSILEDSKAAGDRRTALAALRECRDTLQLLGKCSGWLQDGSTTMIDNRSVTNMFPNWKPDELRAFIAALPSGNPSVTNS